MKKKFKIGLFVPGKKEIRELKPSEVLREHKILKKVGSHNLDLLITPEGFIGDSDMLEYNSVMLEYKVWDKIVKNTLKCPVLVGTSTYDDNLDNWYTTAFLSDGTTAPKQVNTKLSSANLLAFRDKKWSYKKIKAFKVNGAKIGTIICHDLYLGRQSRRLAFHGAQILTVQTGSNANHNKWLPFLRTRAIENGMFTVCTMFNVNKGLNKSGNSGFAAAFSPTGEELKMLSLKTGKVCNYKNRRSQKSDNIYITELDLNEVKEARKKLIELKKPKGSQKKINKAIDVKTLKGQRISFKKKGISFYAQMEGKNKVRLKPDTIRNPIKLEGKNVDASIKLLEGYHLLDPIACWDSLYFLQKENPDSRPILWFHDNNYKLLKYFKSIEKDNYKKYMKELIKARSLELCTILIYTSNSNELPYLVGYISNNIKLPCCLPDHNGPHPDLERSGGLLKAFIKLGKSNGDPPGKESLPRYYEILGKNDKLSKGPKW